LLHEVVKAKYKLSSAVLKKKKNSSPDGWTINHISKQISMHAKYKIRLTVYGHGLSHLG